MKIHEYQAKEILQKYGVAVPAGKAASSVDEAVHAAQKLESEGAELFVGKAQIHAGGRGKGGTKKSQAKGVILCKTVEEVKEAAGSLLGDTLVTIQTGEAGQEIKTIYITDGVEIAQEFYLGILLDRTKNRNVIMVSTEGGVEIEQDAEATPAKIGQELVAAGLAIQQTRARGLDVAI